MPTYTFSCPACGWQADRRAAYGDAAVPCPECGVSAGRASVYRLNFKGFTPTPLSERTYWQEFKDFKEAGAELEYQHSRMEEAAGKPLPSPPLARMAREQAQELIKAGVTSSEDWQSRQKH